MFIKVTIIALLSLGITHRALPITHGIQTVTIIKQSIPPALYWAGALVTGYLAVQNALAHQKEQDNTKQEIMGANVVALSIASGFCLYKTVVGCSKVFSNEIEISAQLAPTVQKNGNISTTAYLAVEL
ncbi:hypothetical protein Noda2021_11270 [Candidatus Dependentiae bacterium Noda2021]|nr:hypothetical protein Noda2021_11270 [Candidatus Dependentiae bacterium Noda2021]